MRTEYTKELIATKPKNFSQTKKEWEDELDHLLTQQINLLVKKSGKMKYTNT